MEKERDKKAKNNPALSVDQVKGLMQAMQQNSITKFKMELEGCTVEMERGGTATQAGKQIAVECTQPSSPEQEPEGCIVKSPIVGTFYAAPSPESKPFVGPGSLVKQGDVLFIIESMKLMNEVTSEFDGTVAEILVENAQPVEYGQPIMRIC